MWFWIWVVVFLTVCVFYFFKCYYFVTTIRGFVVFARFSSAIWEFHRIDYMSEMPMRYIEITTGKYFSLMHTAQDRKNERTMKVLWDGQKVVYVPETQFSRDFKVIEVI